MYSYLKRFDFYDFLWVFFFVPVVLVVYFLTGFPSDPLFGISNFFILFLSHCAIVGNGRSFSLVKIVHIFNFFFFGVVPLNDLANGNLYWGGDEIDVFYYTISNFIILIGVISFLLGSSVRVVLIEIVANCFDKKINFNLFVLGFFYFLVAYLILYFNDFNIASLLFRGVVSDMLSVDSRSYSQLQLLFIDNFLRPMPVILFSIAFVYYTAGRGFSDINLFRKAILFVMLVCSFFLVSPTAIPRFQAASLYMCLIVLCTGLWSRRFSMPLSLMAGLLFVMPMLEKFRYFDPDTFDISFSLSFMNHGHFDAYQNFTRVVEHDLITHGNQLLGSLLFFFPRSLWHEKPIGSGATLAEHVPLSFSNISMPFLGEGYINFGLFGVIAFMFFFGALCSNFDRLFWVEKKERLLSSYKVLYCFLLGMFFFVCRGDLISSFAYTVGLFFSFYFCVYALSITSGLMKMLVHHEK